MTDASRVSVLIVDDQASMRQLMRAGLQLIGIRQVTEAEDGEVALRTVLKTKFNVVISDYNMPKLDGVTLLRAIRAHPPTASLPFILLTGQADRDLVMRAKEHGADNFLAKPFTPASLKDKIQLVLGGPLI